MIRTAWRYAAAAVVLSTVLVVIHGSLHQRVAIEVHLAVVGGLALMAVVRAVSDRCDVRAWRAPALIAPRRRPPAGPVPDGLSQWIGLLSAATEDGRAAAARFAPRLADLLDDRLSTGLGIDSTLDRPAAVAAVGPVAARLAWPTTMPERWSTGISVADVAAAADALDRLP